MVPTRQANQATSHGSARPGREQRQHPGGVDVGQERPGRVVRIAAVEPDPDAGPVGAGVGAAGLAAGDHPGQDEGEGQAEQDDRGHPARIAHARRLAAKGSPEDAGPPAGVAIDDVGQVDDQAPTTSRRAPDRAGVPAAARSSIARAFSHAPRRVPPNPGAGGRAAPLSSARIMADGTVIIIGGAEDKVRDRVILNRFVALAGGATPRSPSSARPHRSASRPASATARSSRELGVKKVRPLHAMTRPQANDETSALAVRDATGIFLTGGNQLRLSSTIGGTRLADAILRSVPARGGRRRHVGRRLGDVEPHDRVRGVGRDAQAPDGPDRRRSRPPARGDRRPALPAAQPARPAAQPDRPEPEPARPRGRRGHRRRRRPRSRDGGHRPRVDHGRRRLDLRDRRLGDPRPPAADDQRRRPPFAAGRLPLRPPPPRAGRHAGSARPAAARRRQARSEPAAPSPHSRRVP